MNEKPDTNLIIRPETTADGPAVRAVNEQAFGRSLEADLVDALRAAGNAAISLVAEYQERVVGHVLFTPAIIETDRGPHDTLALGPLAVLPTYQRQGIGSRLVAAGIDACRREGRHLFVLGHSDYYPRFGFATASQMGIACEFDAPDEAFMVLELVPGALRDITGTVKYAAEFGDF